MKPSPWKGIFQAGESRKGFCVKLLLGLLVGSGCLWFVLWGLDWPRVAETLRRVRPLYLVAAIGLTVLSDLIRVYRWKLFLDPVRSISPFRLFEATIVGFMTNFILPVKAGDLVRAYMACRNEDLHLASSLSTLTVERMFDAIIVLILFGLGLSSLADFPAWHRQFGTILVGVALALAVVVLLFTRYPGMMQRAARSLFRPVSGQWGKGLDESVGRFSQGMASLGSPLLIAKTLLLGFVLWLVMALSYHCSLLALDIHLPFLSIFVLLAAIAFGFALPSLPGATGPYQAAVVLCLAAFNVDRETGLAVSVVTLLSDMVPLLTLGLFFTLRESTPAKEG